MQLTLTTFFIGALTQLYNERPEAIWQILVTLGAIETASLFSNGQGTAGDLGFDPLNFKTKYGLSDPTKLAEMQLRELKNGRLAMLGASGLLLQEVAAGHAPFDF
jgi:light-harvesting complex I chlorophyll a/b binding protein 1